jgi:hypothetical protein
MDDGNPYIEMAARVVVGVLAVLVVYLLLLYRHADFVITLRDGQVHCSKGVPVAWRQHIAAFLVTDLALQGPVKIMGARRDRGRRLALWFRGKISPGDTQRIRNFLASRI